MPVSGETEYTFRTPYPDILKHAAVNTVKMAVHRSNAIVEPTAYLFSLVSPNGTTLIDEATATPDADGIATYQISAATLTTTADNVSLGEGYQEIWKLTLGGVVHTVDRPAALALRPIHSTVADADLLAEYPNLARWTGETTWQTYRDASWHAILRKWLREGGASYLAKEPYMFHDAELNLNLAKILANLGAERDNAEMTTLSETHMARFRAEWPQIVSTMDWDHDGTPDDPERRQRRGTVLHVNVPPNRRPRFTSRRF